MMMIVGSILGKCARITGGIHLGRAACLPALLLLASCNTDDVVGIAAAGLSVAGAVAGASAGGHSSTGASVGGASVGGAQLGNATTSPGYSQRQSFEDCQRMYQQAGMYDLARQCANRATDMSSLQ